MVVNNWNIGMESNMFSAMYEINDLPVDYTTQALSQNILSGE